MAIRYRRYQASSFRFGRQASVRELELTAVIVSVVLLAYFSMRVTTATLWIIFICITVLGLIIGAVCFTIFQRTWKHNVRALQVLGIIDIDNMEIKQFENYIETLLQSHGFQTMPATNSPDGPSFLAQKGRKTIGIQILRQDLPVNSTAVHRAIIRRAHYGYDACMIIATTNFTPAAKRMAFSHRRCILVDRQHLARWILNFQEGRSPAKR